MKINGPIFFKETMKLTKKQAAERMGISMRTLDRKLKNGELQYVREGEGKFARTLITFPDAVEPTPKQEPKAIATPEPKKVTDYPYERPEFDPEWRDSFGHKLQNNEVHRAFAPAPDSPPADLQSHMNPALLGTSNPDAPNGASSDGYTRSGSPLASGLSQDTYNQMMADWRRAHGGLSENEQRIKIENSRRLISAAFPKGDR